MFYNLIDNAIQHTPAGGAITLGLRIGPSQATATVRDTGEGIPVEHVPRVFDRFYRVEKGNHGTRQGAGLGLSIVQSIVALHGGRVELESSFGRGTTVAVTLPLASPAEPV